MENKENSMKPSIYPVKYLHVLRGGTAHVILFSNGKKYVVKWNGTSKKRSKEVVNEYVIGSLAQLFSLPVIPFELVNIPKEFIEQTPELKTKKYNYAPGYQYACVYIENALVFEDVMKNPPTKSKVRNRDMLAGITIFDQWANNTDRGRMNIIFEPFSDGSYYVHMIDHGRCFPGRYQWSAKTLSEQPVYNFHWPFYNWVYTVLNDDSELSAFAEKIVDMPNEKIYEVIQSIPSEWDVTTEDREALYQFLLRQKNNLQDIIERIQDYRSTL